MKETLQTTTRHAEHDSASIKKVDSTIKQTIQTTTGHAELDSASTKQINVAIKNSYTNNITAWP